MRHFPSFIMHDNTNRLLAEEIEQSPYHSRWSQLDLGVLLVQMMAIQKSVLSLSHHATIWISKFISAKWYLRLHIILFDLLVLHTATCNSQQLLTSCLLECYVLGYIQNTYGKSTRTLNIKGLNNVIWIWSTHGNLPCHMSINKFHS